MGRIARMTFPAVAAALMFGCGTQQPPQVSFKNDVQPILDQNCSKCHTEDDDDGVEASGFRTSTYASVMKGTKYGPVIVPGHALSSNLYRLVAGKVDASIQMPHKKAPIPAEEIALIENWIEQGAKDN